MAVCYCGKKTVGCSCSLLEGKFCSAECKKLYKERNNEQPSNLLQQLSEPEKTSGQN